MAADYALSHGLVVNDKTTAAVVHAPVTLFPSPFPKTCFEEAYRLQPLFNDLVERMANSDAFITDSLERVVKSDEFTKRLLDIYNQVKGLEHRQTIRLGIHRSDYMLDVSPSGISSIKQVELNTISSSFSSLSALVSQLHTYLVSVSDDWKSSDGVLSQQSPRPHLPPNESLHSVAKGLTKAWELYNDTKAIVIMVVQPNEGNIYDQRWIEYELFEKYQVKLVRATLAEILEHSQLVGEQRKLVYRGHSVAVVYYRAGYTPTDYPTEREWEARVLIEKSFAVKCPPVEYHLVGTKKIQQILAKEGIVEQFVSCPAHAAQIRSCFTGLYPLDDSKEGLMAVQVGIRRPEDFVLKPQREGGGNNFYGADVKNKLETLSPEERNAYILMELIRPPRLRNWMIRRRELVETEVLSELGVYGIWVSDGPLVHLNESGGHLLRTKTSSSHEGGVAAGFAVLDSPFLT